MSLLHDCLALVTQEAVCVSFVPIRGELGELDGTSLLLVRGTKEGSLVAREGREGIW